MLLWCLLFWVGVILIRNAWGELARKKARVSSEHHASIAFCACCSTVVALLGGNSRQCCVPSARVRVECSSSGEIGSTVEQMVGLGAEEALYTCSLGSVDHGHWV